MKNTILSIFLSLILSGCTNLSLGLMAITGQEDSFALKDSYPHYVNYADKFRKDQKTQRVDIYINTEYDHADIFQFIDNNHLLVGWTQLRGFIPTTISPVHEELALYDISKGGNKIWARKRDNLSGAFGEYRLFGVTNSELLMLKNAETKQLYAINRKTGKDLWEKKLNKLSQVIYIGANPFVASLVENKFRLEKINPKTGKTQWKYDGDTISTQNLANAKYSWDKKAIYYQVNNTITAINESNGRRLWKTVHNFSPDSINITADEDSVIAYDINSIIRFSKKTGGQLWKSGSGNNTIQLVALDGDSIYIFLQDKIKTKLVSLKKRNGNISWRKNLKSFMHSSPNISNKISFSTIGGYYQILKNNGKTLKYVKYPKWFSMTIANKSELLPDIVKYNKNNIIISRAEVGALSISKKRSKLIWSQKVFSYKYDEFGYSYASKTAGLNTAIKKASDAANNPQPSINFIRPRENINKKILSDFRFHTDIDKQNARGERARRDTGLLNIESTLMGNVNREEKRKALEGMVNAALNVTVARLTGKKIVGDININRQQIALFEKSHSHSITDNYYNSPFSEHDIRGYSLIRTRDGKRNNLVTSPQFGFTYSGIMDQHAISPDNNWFLTLGTGMDTSKFTSYTRRARTMPKYALIGYQLNKLKFGNDDSLRKRGVNNDFYGWNDTHGLFPYHEPALKLMCGKYGEPFSGKPIHERKKLLLKYKNIDYCWPLAIQGFIIRNNTKLADFMIKNGFDIHKPYEAIYGETLLGSFADLVLDVKIFNQLLKYNPDPTIVFKQPYSDETTAMGLLKEKLSSNKYKKGRKKKRLDAAIKLLADYEKNWRNK